MEKRHSKWAWLLLLSSKWEWLVLMSKWALRLLLPWLLLLLLLWRRYEKQAASLIFASFTFNSTGCLFYRQQRHMAAVTHTHTQMHTNLIKTYKTVTHTCSHTCIYAKSCIHRCINTHTHSSYRQTPLHEGKHIHTHFYACIYTHVCTEIPAWTRTNLEAACGRAAMSDGADGGNSLPSLKQNK